GVLVGGAPQHERRGGALDRRLVFQRGPERGTRLGAAGQDEQGVQGGLFDLAVVGVRQVGQQDGRRLGGRAFAEQARAGDGQGGAPPALDRRDGGGSAAGDFGV